MAVFVATAGLIMPLASINFPVVNAAPPKIAIFKVDGNPISSTEVQYVDISDPTPYTLNVIASDPDLVSLPTGTPVPSIFVPGMPPGASIGPYTGTLPLDSAGVQFSWNKSVFSGSDFYQPFVVNFNATDAAGETSGINATFVLFARQAAEPTVDKEKYVAGENATVTVFDPRANKDGYNDQTVKTLETITATAGTLPITLTEVDTTDDPTARSGTFRATLNVSSVTLDGSRNFKVSYAEEESKQIHISEFGVRLDRKSYTTGDTATVRVIASAGSPSTLELDGSEVSATLDRTGSYTLSLPLTTKGNKSLKLKSQGIADAVTATVDDVSAEFEDARPDNATQRSSYYSNETAEVRVINYHKNMDRTKAEFISGVTLISVFDPGTSISMDLLETGVDTGVFTSTTLIGFTNVTTDVNVSSKLLKIPTNPGESTTISLQYGDGSDTDDDTATVTVAELDLPDTGIGGTSGTPVAATAITSVTNLNCSSYGGDTERDGICDGWEAPTKTYLTIPYGGSNWVFSYACDPTCPHSSNDDILLEIDTIDSAGPSAGVLSDIKTEFDAHDYKLHYRVNENIDIPNEGGIPVINVWDDPTGGDDLCEVVDSFREIKLKYFGEGTGERLGTTTDPCANPAINNKGAAKKQVWHYCLFGTTTKQKWSAGTAIGTSGLSESIGNDCLVTLGGFAGTANQQRGTLMHELGHNLGLRHGGGVGNIAASPLIWIADSNANCKPNYVSPMSYTHQFPGGVSGVTLSHWTYSYSDSILTLNEYDSWDTDPDTNRLNEGNAPYSTSRNVDIAWHGAAGNTAQPVLIGTSGTDINWDGVNGIGGNVWNNDVNNFGIRDCNTPTTTNAPGGIIRGFDDWDRLVLDMRVNGGSNWNIPGFFEQSNELDDIVWKNITMMGPQAIYTQIQLLDSSAFIDPNDPTQTNATQIKEYFERILVKSSSRFGVARDPSAVEHINQTDIPAALEKLYEAMRGYDGDEGGNPKDDLINGTNAKAALFETTQGVIRTLIEELEEDKHMSFGLSWSNYYDSYLTIIAKSSTVNATDRSFIHEKDPNNSSRNSITFTINGTGHLELELERGLVDGELTESNTVVIVDNVNVNATFSNSTRSKFFGSHIEFDIPSGPDKVHEVVIMGANVVPEFPATSTLVLALTIVAIITLTALAARTKNRFGSSLLPGRWCPR
jgi:hypothetical protein